MIETEATETGRDEPTLDAPGKLIPLDRLGPSEVSWLDGPICEKTARRWASEGLIGRDGQRVKLRVMRGSSGLCTTRAWLYAFLGEISPSPDIPTKPIRPPTPGQRQRAADRVEAVLDAAGI